ncbi:MAG: phosphotransferase [Acetatifactor sp.]|nr:phosphotransferase [Acetatifactor sp.]
MKEQIKRVLEHWGITDFSITERYHENTGRILCRIDTGNQTYFLKGIPVEKGEKTVRGNVLAHEYLGNREHMAPAILYTKEGNKYIFQGEHWFYLMEYIEGRNLQETEEDEYALGQLTAKLHGFTEYTYPSGLNQDKSRFYGWFSEKNFKTEFDRILDGLPDFSVHDQCFIHSDLGPHNAMRGSGGEIVFIDLDDAGIGSRYLDLGWAFIMQFVDFDHQTEEMRYRFDLALAFLRGYYERKALSREEYEWIWKGAVYMHISYMQVYGPDAVDSLWAILKYGMAQKEELWKRWC